MSDWEALSKFREWSGVPLACPGMVGRTSQLSGSGHEDLRMSGVVVRTSWISRSSQEGLPDVRECSGGPPDVRVFGRPSRMSGSGRETIPVVSE